MSILQMKKLRHIPAQHQQSQALTRQPGCRVWSASHNFATGHRRSSYYPYGALGQAGGSTWYVYYNFYTAAPRMTHALCMERIILLDTAGKQRAQHLQVHQIHPSLLGPTPRSSALGGLEWGPRVCISNNSQGCYWWGTTVRGPWPSTHWWSA